MFPSSMLAKLFVKNSLKNTETGFEMKIKNIIDYGTLVGMGPLVVDGTTYAPSQVSVKANQVELMGDQIDQSRPLPIPVMAEVRVTVRGAKLEPGEHKVTLQMFVREAGKMQFSVDAVVE